MKIKYFLAGLTALAIVITFGGQVLASGWNWDGGGSDSSNILAGDPITITNDNSATITNNIEVSAETGENESTGGDSEAESGSSNNFFGQFGQCCNASSETQSSNGGNGGDITTGDANANALVVNVVNTNYNEASSSGFTGGDDVTITNDNNASLTNNVEVEAETGENESNGGDAEAEFSKYSGGSSEGGTGGNIETGMSDSSSDVFNVVNTNINRIFSDDSGSSGTSTSNELQGCVYACSNLSGNAYQSCVANCLSGTGTSNIGPGGNCGWNWGGGSNIFGNNYGWHWSGWGASW